MLGHVIATYSLIAQTIILDDRALNGNCSEPNAKVVNFPLGVVFWVFPNNKW